MIVVRPFFPRTSWRVGNNLGPDGSFIGANGYNNMVSIWAWTGIAHPAAVMAQERAEWEWCLKRAALLGLPLAAALAAAAVFIDPGVLIALPIAFLIPYFMVRELPPFQRAAEYHGHAVEIIAAENLYGEARAALEDAELRSLTGGGYSQFRGVNVAVARAGLQAAYPAAAEWTRRHDKLLRSYVADVERLR